MLTKAAKREKLKLLKEARKTGGRVLLDSDDETNLNEIYDEVDEETFREHKRHQLMNDDFIVDDNGEGYVDNGADEWDDSSRPNYYSDEDDVDSNKRKRKKKDEQRPIKVAKTAPINNFFKSTTIRTNEVKKVDMNIDDILEGFQDVPQKKVNVAKSFANFKKSVPIKKRKPNTSFTFSTINKERKSPSVEAFNASSDYTMDFEEVEQPSSPVTTIASDAVQEKENVDPASSPRKEVKSEKTLPESKLDESDSDDDVIFAKRPKTSGVKREHNTATISSVKAGCRISMLLESGPSFWTRKTE